MRLLVFLCCGLIAASLPCTASAQTRAADPARWSGCYAVQLGAWSPEVSRGNLPYHTPPATIELDTSIIRTGPDAGMRALSPLLTVRFGPIEPGAYWQTISADSAILTWTGRLAGSVVRVGLTPSGFSGIAEAFSDVVTPGPPPRAVITATKQACRRQASPRITLVVAPGDTGRAIAAAVDFVQTIIRDSVVMAGCDARAETIRVGTDVISLPVDSPSTRQFCKSNNSRGADGVRVIVESVRRIDTDVILPYWDRINFEVALQVQFGRSIREWHTVLVRPAGGIPKDTGMEARGWRVSGWRITQWMSVLTR